MLVVHFSEKVRCSDISTENSFETSLDRLRVGEVSRGEKMLYSGTDPESYITEYTLVYEDKM